MLTDRQLADIQADVTEALAAGSCPWHMARHAQYLLDEVARLKQEAQRPAKVPHVGSLPSYPGYYPRERLNPNAQPPVMTLYGAVQPPGLVDWTGGTMAQGYMPPVEPPTGERDQA